MIRIVMAFIFFVILTFTAVAASQGDNMKLTSSAFTDKGNIPAKYTCDGTNINPPLHISDVPSTAKSLVLILEDPDVPKTIHPNGMWDHWIVFNIPPNTQDIKEGQAPAGKYGVGSAGSEKYQGPCPPDKAHRYFFKLFALDTLLSLPEKATKQQVQQAMQGHIVAKTELVGMYVRS